MKTSFNEPPIDSFPHLRNQSLSLDIQPISLDIQSDDFGSYVANELRYLNGNCQTYYLN